MIELHELNPHKMRVAANTTKAAWSCMEPHGAAWSHRVNYKYYRSRMETLSIRSKDAWSCMESHRAAWTCMEPHGATV